MLRRTHPLPDDALPMLREKDLKRLTDVYTSDGEHLGLAIRYYHRAPDEVAPELRLYRSYLVVQSVEMGGPIYVPTPFVGAYDPAANKLVLSVPLNMVEEEVWNRTPDFVARGQGVPEELP